MAESVLPGSVELPASDSIAPWRVRAEITMWAGRSVRGAAGVLPDALGERRALSLTTGALVDVRESPVGPYRELWASPAMVWTRGLRLHVPFIAVDSLPSAAAGRRLWAFPKTVASFDDREVLGDGWRVHVASVARGPELPIWRRVRCVQVRTDGSLVHFRVRVSGRVRLCRVQIETDGPTLGDWLPSRASWGLHGEVTMRVGTATVQSSDARKVSHLPKSPES